MKTTTILTVLALLAGLALFVLIVTAGLRNLEGDTNAPVATSPVMAPSTPAAVGNVHQGFLYGRVTTDGGVTYEGRLRWGGDEEAFWGDTFNGSKDSNPWVAHMPPETLRKEGRPIEILGITVAHRERPMDLDRPLMARFGDIAQIQARGDTVEVTLKSGTVLKVNRFAANDFDDGLRVWDGQRGAVDLDSRWIRTIELRSTTSPGAAPERLYGSVRTQHGDFTGFVQWDRQECVGTDELDGHTTDGELSLRFDTIRSIARHSPDSSLVTLLDGSEKVLAGSRKVGHGNRGLYVNDRRYGRVLISWDVFERVDFSPGGSGPAYGDFPPGGPLMGSVTTRSGRHLVGRLVYDLDESEITETLDAPSRGVDYTIPFGLIASIVPAGREERGAQRARVTLHNGEELQLERTGDLGEGNAGMLIFIEGCQLPEVVPWPDVEQVNFDRPPAMYPAEL